MNNDAHSISAVERDTGLSKDLLRMWERRYGFPQPLRDARGERLYPAEQVARLRLIKRLLDQGRRPGTLMRLADDALVQMLGSERSENGRPSPLEAKVIRLLRGHGGLDLRAELNRALLKQGLQNFVRGTLAPLNVAIGDAWMKGEIEIAEEHLYTEQVQNVLRSAIGMHSNHGTLPRVLLTTFPEEQHALGLLMVEAVLVAEGASCVSLGNQTPVPDVGIIATAGAFDIVALSFSAAYPLRGAIEGLRALRARLPSTMPLWAGGAGLKGRRPDIDGVLVLDSLDACIEALCAWRERASS